MTFTLPTSLEIRKELRGRRWEIDHEGEGTERWRCHDGQGVIRLKEGFGVTWIEGWPSVVLPALAIMGQLAPKGMVLVSVEDAKECDSALCWTLTSLKETAYLHKQRGQVEVAESGMKRYATVSESLLRLRRTLYPVFPQELPTSKE